MDFINELFETEYSLKCKENHDLKLGSYEEYGYRMLEPVEVNNNVHLSIQASYSHYCTPRKTVDIKDYTSMELAISKDDLGGFLSVDKVIDNKDIIEKFEEYFEGMVYMNVPVELIEELYQELT